MFLKEATGWLKNKIGFNTVYSPVVTTCTMFCKILKSLLFSKQDISSYALLHSPSYSATALKELYFLMNHDYVTSEVGTQIFVHRRLIFLMAKPRCWWFTAGLLPRRTWFIPRPGRVGFLCQKPGTETGFPRERRCFPLSLSFHQCSTLIRLPRRHIISATDVVVK